VKPVCDAFGTMDATRGPPRKHYHKRGREIFKGRSSTRVKPDLSLRQDAKGSVADETKKFVESQGIRKD